MNREFDVPQMLALASALGWASGLRLYSVVFFTGLLAQLGWVDLPAGLHVLQHPAMLWASGAMVLVEFFADKIPGVDSLWDILHTFIRVPAGAALAASVFGGDDATWASVAALLGGTLAATSHIAKATTRATVNASPEPFSNIALSLAGDAVAPASVWLSLTHPAVFAVALLLAVLLMLTVIWVLGGTMLRVWRSVARRFAGSKV